jgi:hypothetical protein
MLDWLAHPFSSLPFTGLDVIVGTTFFVGTMLGSIALVVFFLIRLPPTYFHPSHDRRWMDEQHRVVRCFARIVKNLVGAILVVLGIVMSLPGVPGQGILTVFVGIMLLDFPGKRAWEYKIVSRPRILRTINQLRKKMSKPPLVLK